MTEYKPLPDYVHVLGADVQPGPLSLLKADVPHEASVVACNGGACPVVGCTYRAAVDIAYQQMLDSPLVLDAIMQAMHDCAPTPNVNALTSELVAAQGQPRTAVGITAVFEALAGAGHVQTTENTDGTVTLSFVNQCEADA